MMNKEIKITLPFYKIVYSIFFIVILSIIRGVTYTYEIGSALEPPMAILAAVLFADTYVQEIVSKRSEVQRLYPMKKRTYSIMKRMMIQGGFLSMLAVIGYGLFFVFQNPLIYGMEQADMGKEMEQFIICLVAMMITLGFWGILSNTLSCIFRNMWVGIAGCLIIWLITNSSFGAKHFGPWNLFSYTFRNIENSSDFNWMYGKIMCICFCIIMLKVLPKILKKRG